MCNSLFNSFVNIYIFLLRSHIIDSFWIGKEIRCVFFSANSRKVTPSRKQKKKLSTGCVVDNNTQWTLNSGWKVREEGGRRKYYKAAKARREIEYLWNDDKSVHSRGRAVCRHYYHQFHIAKFKHTMKFDTFRFRFVFGLLSSARDSTSHTLSSLWTAVNGSSGGPQILSI